MDENSWNRHETGRITCYIRTDMRSAITELLAAMGIDEIFVESGKNVRQLSQNSFLGLLGRKGRLHNSPIDIYRFSVDRENHREILEKIIDSGEISLSKHGTINQVRRLQLQMSDKDTAAYERGIICAPDGRTEQILEALFNAEESDNAAMDLLQVMNVPVVYSHKG